MRWLPEWALRIMLRRSTRKLARLNAKVETLRNRIALGERIARDGWDYRSLSQMELATELGLPKARSVLKLLRKYPEQTALAARP